MAPKFSDLGRDDLFAVFNLCCAVLGIGSLAIGHNYARAGPYLATLALLLMCAINTYATAALSKCFRNSPDYVKTFGDLGEFIMGKFGRYAVVITQFGTCILIPVAFLVLGGAIILPAIFYKSTLTANAWIPIMAVAMHPIVLIPSLKDGAWVSFIGALGAVVGACVAITDSLVNSPYYDNSSSGLETGNIATAFGSMALAYGAAVVIPSIQRDHSKPENLPYLICVSLIVTTGYYMALGLLTYYQYGCVSPSNLLLSMTNKTMEVVAMISFFIAVCISFAVLLNPALYLFERTMIGLEPVEEEEGSEVETDGSQLSITRSSYISCDSPAFMLHKKDTKENEGEKTSTPSIQQKKIANDLEKNEILADPRDISYYKKKYTMKRVILRTVVVGVLAFLAMILQGCFSQLADFIGATTITMSCIVIPIAMHLVMFRESMGIIHKILAVAMIVISLCLGTYTAVQNMENMVDTISSFKLFSPEASSSPSTLNIEYCESVPFELVK